MQNLYSYTDSWEHKAHGKTLKKAVKRATLLRSVALILFIPIDAFYLLCLIVSRKKVGGFTATAKWPDFSFFLSKKYKTAFIASPDQFIRLGCLDLIYLPASPVYVLSAIGYIIPQKFSLKWSQLAILAAANYMQFFSIKKKRFLIVHSDALPFGRSLVLAARSINVTTLCIQHGSFFSLPTKVGEVDGCLSEINIVRSKEDEMIIKPKALNSKFLVIPEFFTLSRSRGNVGNKPTILFLGEGYHTVDPAFNKKYLAQLEIIYSELACLNVECIFRPHPSEKYIGVSKNFKNIDSLPLEESISRIDCVIGFSSTLLQECGYLGIPSLFIEVEGHHLNVKGRNGAIITKYGCNSDLLLLAQDHFSKRFQGDLVMGVLDKHESFDKICGLIDAV